MWINEFMSLLYWHNLSALGLLLLPFILIIINTLQQKATWSKIASPQLKAWLQPPLKISQNRVLRISVLTAYGLLVIALAGPRTIQSIPPQFSPTPTELSVIIDFSASMNALDTHPSRKLAAIEFLSTLNAQKPEHLKIGIIVFAGHAFQVMPATFDQQLIAHFINSIKALRLPTLGNNLSDALQLSFEHFDKDSDEHHVLVMTDGDLGEKQQQQVLRLLSNPNSSNTIQFVAIGDKQAIAVPDDNNGFIKSNERIVQTQLQTQWFKQLNKIEHVGTVELNQVSTASMTSLIHLAPLAIDTQLQEFVVWHEWFYIPTVLALLLLVFCIKWHHHLHKASASAIGLLLLLPLMFHQDTAQAFEPDALQKAITLIDQQQFTDAITLLKTTKHDKAQFALGVACYYAKDFNCANKAFSQTAWNSTSSTLRAQSVFNLANTQFFLGEYEQASVLYDAAKKMGFDAQKSQHNQQFADSIQTSIEREIDTIKKSFKKAKWRAAALGLPEPDLNQFVANQRNVAQIDQKKVSQAYLTSRLTQQAIKQQLGLVSDNNSNSTQWVKTEAAKTQTTDALLKRLFEMQLAIPSSLQEPKSVKGQRPW